MQDSGNSDQSNSSNEFKLWFNIFDGLKYLYDDLNTTKDVEKVKTIGAQQLTQNLGAYLMKCTVMTWVLFELVMLMSRMIFISAKASPTER